MDEVNNFLANFKKKRGKKGATTTNEAKIVATPKEKPIEEKKKDDDKFKEDNNKQNTFFNKENNPSEIFDNNDEKDNNVESIFDNNKKEEENNIEQIFGKKDNKGENNIINQNNDVQKIYSNFDNGIVLNNPLLNEQEHKNKENFEEKENSNNFTETNFSNNNIFGTENDNNDEAKNIFDSTNDNNVDNIFSQPNDINNNNKNIEQNNIYPPKKNIPNLNRNKPQPKPPKLNNKFNSPFINKQQKIKDNINQNIENMEQTNEDNVNNLFDNNQNDKNNDEINTLFNNDNTNSYQIFEERNKAYPPSSIKSQNEEIEKLDEDQIVQPFKDSSNNLNENNFNDYHNSNMNKIDLYENINNNNIIKNRDTSSNIQKKSDNFINDENSINNNESYGFSCIDKDYVLLSSNGGENISVNNIYSILNSYSENQLYEYYFPISYNKEKDFNKLSSLLSIILNNGNELNEPISHVAVNLLKYVLENQINIKALNILNNNDLKNKIIDILSNSIRNENKGILSLNNLFNTEILFNSLNNSSSNNYEITNDSLFHPLDYIINLFNEKILNKNNMLYLYILLLNMNENENNHNIGFEEYDYIFENFDSTLYIILKYFSNDIIKIKNICNLLLNSYSPKSNFCHFIILKCLLNDYEIKNEKFYGKLLVNFLQFPNIEKLLIADIYNLILFNSLYKKIIAKSSILIKYKYALVKQNYKKDQNLVLFQQKIYENINQFGAISKNNYFKNYLKESFFNNKLDTPQASNQNNKILSKSNDPNDSSSNKISYPNEKENNGNIPDNGGNQGGLFSTLKYAFGFGSSDQDKDRNDNNGQRVISEEEKRRMSPEELWKLEHPREPEVKYDPVLKRYILRGKIYDDQEEVIQKNKINSPMVPPPKSNKYLNKNNNDNKNNNIDNNYNGQENFSNATTMSQENNIPPMSNNRINNPFNSGQLRKQPKPPNQKQKMNNLMNRYAVGYNK